MKLTANYLIRLAFAALLFAALLPACRKDSLSDSTVQSPARKIFEKAITVTDRSGSNSVNVTVSGNDETQVNSFSESSFELEVLSEALENIDDEPVISAAVSESSNAEQGIHFTITGQDLQDNVKGITLKTRLYEEGVMERAWVVDAWFHNNFISGNRFRKTKVWASSSFFVEGIYTGFWPFWQRKYGNFWTTSHTTPVYFTNNLSVHVTQTNTSVIAYSYWY